jgi:putative ABC transport system permease protein
LQGEVRVGDWKLLERYFHKFSPDFILDYNFLDSEFDYRFSQLKSMGRIMTIAGYLAIIIACMGLLGLTVHTSERKVKELGIRKINGAGVVDLIRLLSGQISKVFLQPLQLPIPWPTLSIRLYYRILPREFSLVCYILSGHL